MAGNKQARGDIWTIMKKPVHDARIKTFDGDRGVLVLVLIFLKQVRGLLAETMIINIEFRFKFDKDGSFAGDKLKCGF